jgi:hypothetical protein
MRTSIFNRRGKRPLSFCTFGSKIYMSMQFQEDEDGEKSAAEDDENKSEAGGDEEKDLEAGGDEDKDDDDDGGGDVSGMEDEE